MKEKSNMLLSVRSKYDKLNGRFQNAVKDGRFQLFSPQRKRKLLQSLGRYERQLQQWGIAVVTGAALLLPATNAMGQTPVGSEFQVNTTTIGLQNSPRIASDPNGNFVVAWEDVATDGDFFGVFAQRFNSAGEPQGSEFQVSTVSSGSQYTPAIAMDDDGDFVIAFVNVDGDGISGNYDVYARRFASDGTPQGSEFLVNTGTVGKQRYHDVAMDSNGAFVITWAGDTDGDGYGIFAQRFNNAGNPVGGEFAVNTFTADFQYSTAVAMDNDGDFVVAWESYHTPEASIFARRYDNAGVAQGAEFQVNTDEEYLKGYLDIAMDNDGDFVVVWESYYQDGAYYSIYGQRYDNAGTPQGGEFQINTDTQYYHRNPAIGMDSNGDFVVAWTDYGLDGDYYGVYAQSYNNAGVAQGANFRVNTQTANYQSSPDVAMDSDGNFIIAWSSYEQDGDGYGIFAQRFASGAGSECGIPLGLATTDVGNHAATLNWEPTSDAKKYKIQLQNIPTGEQTTFVMAPGEVSTLVSGLASETRYRWFIKAKCPTGWTVASPWQLFTTTGIFALVGEASDIAGYSGNDETLFQNEGRMVLQPNPASDMVQLTSLDQSFQSIRITDQTGRVVLEQSGLNTSQVEIDVRDLANGLYHLHTQSGEKSQVLPLVIMK